MTRLYIYADDSMQGRLTGTAGNFRATTYIAGELQKLGLEPAGEQGTYFQTIPLVRRAVDPRSSLAAGRESFRLYDDYVPRDQGPKVRPIDGVQAVWGGRVGGDLIASERTVGKLVVVGTTPGPDGRPRWQVGRLQLTTRYPQAAGIAVATLDAIPAEYLPLLKEPAQRFGEADTAGGVQPAFLYVTSAAAAKLIGRPLDGLAPGSAGQTVRGSVAIMDQPTEAPARNVVAILRGTDPALRGEYVAIGAHNDHIGIEQGAVDHDSLKAYNSVMRPFGAESNPGEPTPEQWARIRAALDSLRRLYPGARPDSIANGADDDGSGTVSVLEVAQALAAAKGKDAPRRSILFVWHTGEELGLYGSSWFTDHPTVPRDSIVAQLNIDMIGRGSKRDLAAMPGADATTGGPRYVQLIGSRRLSTELGDLVERVNREDGHGFTFDYQFDAPGHPEQYYCRSDHYMYARYGIPVTFFSTGGHQDYHQLTDEPQYIDYEHMANVARLIEDVAVHVANLDHRVVVDRPKPDPKGECRQ
jgi:hypothetical protein